MAAETILAECKKIDVPKVDGSKRTFSKEFAVKLADSIKVDGQLQPIILRPNPASTGRFILVGGKHRLYAMKTVLKEQFIRATVFEEMDDAEAEIAADVENLWRNSLSKAQHAAAVKRWHASWLAKLPQIDPKAVAAEKVVKAIGQNDQNATGEANTTESAASASAATEITSEAEFDQKVAAVTGQSDATVRRSKKIGMAFTPEQLEVFTQMDTNQTDMLTIAKIKDVGKRGEVVSLVAAGMDPNEAVKDVMKEAAPVRYNNGGAEAVAAKEAAKEEKRVELTDEEWFQVQCGEKAAMFSDPSKYKADALLFRAVSDLRHTFRVKAKASLATAKKAGVTGSFFNLINRFVSTAHPKDWLICPECKGVGIVGSPEAPKRCPKCFGGCYLIKTEEFI